MVRAGKLWAVGVWLLLVPGRPVLAVFSPKDRTELRTAVNSWVRNRTEALRVYKKPIGEWDVSAVDSMEKMICG